METIDTTAVLYRIINVLVCVLWLPIFAVLFCIQIVMFLSVIPIYWILTGRTDNEYLYPIVFVLERVLEQIEKQENRQKGLCR